jgi:hypothetical protein
MVVIIAPLQAQRGWELGGGGGVAHYFGDLNTSFDFSHLGVNANIGARFNFNERICTKLAFNYGTVSADDAYSKNSYELNRNLNFKSILLDASGQLEFNFLPYIHGSKDEFFTPYLFAGFNVYYFNPTTTYQGKTYELRSMGTEGQFKGEEYYSVLGGLTYGAGFKIDLNYRWSVNIEISARKLFNDYLDDVSTVYPNTNDVLKQRNDIAAALSNRSLPLEDGKRANLTGKQRGNANDTDSYVFTSIGLYYYFGNLKCPPLTGR